mgnify:CR=1 FL=1
MKKKIKIFITGGTFDKEYNEITGELDFKNSHMYELLELGRCKLDISVETLMKVDSIHMSEEQREYIIKKCIDEESNHIIIIHGTDTMIQTAKLLKEIILDKTIILTGAMIPVKFGGSDGLFNLGSALSFVQVLPYGVSIAMNGKIFSPSNVHKNKKLGIFESLELV